MANFPLVLFRGKRFSQDLLPMDKYIKPKDGEDTMEAGKRHIDGLPSAVIILLIVASVGCQQNQESNQRLQGGLAAIGNGNVESYADLDAKGTPLALGVLFQKGALENLPTALSDGNRCADFDGDGTISSESECLPWHERVLPLPDEISRNDSIPFKWVLLNFNPHGHMPEGVWNVPHFDVHFYMQPIERVFAIMPGDCGPERMRCDQFELATKPLPSNYINKDYQNVDAAAPAMGNHLVDPTAEEFTGKPFTRSWIFGTYDGQITFWEEMLSLDFLNSKPNECFPIKLPEAVAVSGYYPSHVCTRYNEEDGSVGVSVEEFKYWQADPPQTGDISMKKHNHP